MLTQRIAGHVSIRRAFGTLAARVRCIAIGRRNRRDVWLLAHSDYRVLKDLGLTQADTSYALSAPFWRDPSERLRRVAAVSRVDT